MSMYVEMLSSALEARRLEMSSDEMVDHALHSRRRMLGTGTASGASAYDALAAEVTYDLALIELCNDVGIVASPTAFDKPEAERTRLERALIDQMDLDLVALSRVPGDDEGPPPVPYT